MKAGLTHTVYLAPSVALLYVMSCLPLIILAVINRFWYKLPFHPRGHWRWNVAASSAHECVTKRWCATRPPLLVGCCIDAVLYTDFTMLISTLPPITKAGRLIFDLSRHKIIDYARCLSGAGVGGLKDNLYVYIQGRQPLLLSRYHFDLMVKQKRQKSYVWESTTTNGVETSRILVSLDPLWLNIKG